MSFLAAISPTKVHYHPFLIDHDFFPKEIFEAVDQFQEIDMTDIIPLYGPNIIHSYRDKNGWRGLPEKPLIQQGFDKKKLPFLIVFVPGFPPLVYHPYSDTKDFRKLDNWVVGTLSDHNICKEDIALLAKITNGEECKDARRAILVKDRMNGRISDLDLPFS